MEIYTDGSCLGNPGPGGWAVIGPNFELCGGLPITTNNIMEMTAVIECLKAHGNKNLIIYTDSCYVKNGITTWVHGWKKNGWMTSKKEPVKNKELWIELDSLNGPHVEWKWVRAHAGNKNNELADTLAKQQAKSFQNLQ
jgi:ribonuclease HI